ncbi:MAG: YqaE/Pmp3 family membrane protein [Bacteroidia bacterium]
MRYFLCFILPPLAVLSTGKIGAFILSIILTICFWVPGIIHAILVVSNHHANKRNDKLVKAMRNNN